MAGYLKAGDTLSGQEAVAKITVKNSNGTTTIEDMFWAKNLEATAEIQKTEVYTLGKRGAQNKPNGWSGSGSMTIYFVTSLFRKMAIDYIKKGIPVYFDMMVTNSDPGSTVGAQTIMLKDCTLDSVILAKFDVETEVLDENVDFTFDDVEMLSEFSDPIM